MFFDLIWFNRNIICHGSLPTSVQEMSLQATRLAKDHWNSIAISSTKTRSSPNQIWISPPWGWLKINTDSIFVNWKAHSSHVIRNKNGSIVLASPQYHNRLDFTTVESLALLDACKLLDHFKIKEAIFEADSLNVIAYIRGASGISFWTASPVIDQIRNFLKFMAKMKIQVHAEKCQWLGLCSS